MVFLIPFIDMGIGDTFGPLLIGVGWLVALTIAALAVFRRVAEPERA